ncbi:LPS assembly lipoprotein LptE [Roseomonas sp. 18066]|uniref:LPS assembly lipoprotein LptE n=1 Tax=Roseomonas sp. 18066 TaxID=2681412 RepID=UPI001357E257|nr:LPS assembly lipoprotein LptE [Roseomonas sp. 18066]
MSRAGSSTSSSDRRPAGASRRALLVLAAGSLPLAACGFRPLYGSGGGAAGGLAGSSERVRGILASTQVGLIPERTGQLMRRSLTEKLGAAGASSPVNELRVSLQLSAEPEGFRRDGTASRVRYNATASWQLITLTPPPATLAQGVERTFDSYNVPDNQFFAADFSRDATMVRLIDQLADDIVLRLSVRLGEANTG